MPAISIPSELKAIDSPTTAGDPREELRARALGRLTGQFSHELRNVLTGVRCYIELLAGVPLPPEVGDYLTEIQAGLDRMTDLAGLWHDLSRGRCASGYLNGEVGRVVQLLCSMGVTKRTRLRESLDPAVGLTTADGEALEAVLLALMADLVERQPVCIDLLTSIVQDEAQLRIEALGVTRESIGALDLEAISRLIGTRICRLEAPLCGFELRLPQHEPDESFAHEA